MIHLKNPASSRFFPVALSILYAYISWAAAPQPQSVTFSKCPAEGGWRVGCRPPVGSIQAPLRPPAAYTLHFPQDFHSPLRGLSLTSNEVRRLESISKHGH
ncbi:hypothetical protein GWI33_015740 [Rhynchophorus ferrugineus]|uniref:Uncharacterized protein n=1 Tax=Rhynchophorus ferrugineus TaxID=354439 RepID=A0A834HZC4_RHYFE|nr:hypothetical protein GWI33_015740 [Rhynchophorus ferrugineus]